MPRKRLLPIAHVGTEELLALPIWLRAEQTLLMLSKQPADGAVQMRADWPWQWLQMRRLAQPAVSTLRLSHIAAMSIQPDTEGNTRRCGCFKALRFCLHTMTPAPPPLSLNTALRDEGQRTGVVGHARGQAWAPESEWQGDMARLKGRWGAGQSKCCPMCAVPAWRSVASYVDSHGRESGRESGRDGGSGWMADRLKGPMDGRTAAYIDRQHVRTV